MAKFTITTVTPDGKSDSGEREVSGFDETAAVLGLIMLGFIQSGYRDNFPGNYVVEMHETLYSHENDTEWSFSMERVGGIVDTFSYSA